MTNPSEVLRGFIKMECCDSHCKYCDKEVSDKDIKEVSNKDDIIGAIPYIDEEKIDVEVEQ
jgi:organic radical activating enzyme